MPSARRPAGSFSRRRSLEREHQRANVRLLKAELSERQFPILDGGTHIVPLMVGDAARCKALADALLQEHSIYVQPINYPTVPRGRERLRLTPGPFHGPELIAQLVDALEAAWTSLALPRAA
jgi:5-aminolevulinate synthase